MIMKPLWSSACAWSARKARTARWRTTPTTTATCATSTPSRRRSSGLSNSPAETRRTPSMSDLPTLEQRWSIASLSLEKHGMDVRKIAPLLQAVMLRQLEADEIIGADDDEWQDWVDAELEAHPAWALPRWFRLKHARDLINNWHQGWGDPGSDPEPEELAEHKYAVMSWYDGNSLVRSAGDTIENVLEAICMM